MYVDSLDTVFVTFWLPSLRKLKMTSRSWWDRTAALIESAVELNAGSVDYPANSKRPIDTCFDCCVQVVNQLFARSYASSAVSKKVCWK